ncbi:hypothetical protein Glove_535g18 [Diversispora epigaea]|uniref:Uncharacterized protein n=1 Tax=Diversispora epigaea TaxID=1348612 RepID=A0A397GH45_9GLOM|nr:hypothetical protein Glove_535g18 [Diversispora epigaea]
MSSTTTKKRNGNGAYKFKKLLPIVSTSVGISRAIFYLLRHFQWPNITGTDLNHTLSCLEKILRELMGNTDIPYVRSPRQVMLLRTYKCVVRNSGSSKKRHET